jgi:glycerol kinase
MHDVVLALDQGTTSSKAILVDGQLRVRGSSSSPVPISRLSDGRVEQDPEAIWHSCVSAISGLGRAMEGVRIAAMAVSNQRESVLAWDAKTGEPVTPLLSWQDQRTAAWVSEFSESDRDAVRDRTGLELDPMFSAPKIRWLLQSLGTSRQIRVGTLESWLVLRLTGDSEPAQPVCEAGNASRTLLFDIRAMDWHPELLALFDIPASVLPTVQRSDATWGSTSRVPGVPDGTPLRAVLADSHAALFGHWALVPEGAGAPKATYGTGSSVMAPVERPDIRRKGVSTTVAWLTSTPQWALEGNILYAGSGLDWLARTLGVGDGGALSRLAATVDTSDGAVFVPALNGLGAPWWQADASGTLTGLTARTEPAHIARAGLESLAHQVCDVLDAMALADATQPLHAGGGATASDLLMQTQADMSGRSVLVAPTADISALGAAVMAGRAVGMTMTPREKPNARTHAYNPTDNARELRSAARAAWHQALRRAGVHDDLSMTPASAGA